MPGGAHRIAGSAASPKPTVVYRNLALLDGQTATVYSNGLAQVFSWDRRGRAMVEYRMIPPNGMAAPGTAAALPDKAQLIEQLSRAPASPYVAGTLEVVLSSATSATKPVRTVQVGTLRALRKATPRPGASASGPVPAYTTRAGLNRVLAGLGVDRMAQVFHGASAGAPGNQAAAGGLDLAHTYVVHVTNAAMPAAMSALLASPAVAYAAPDWTVAPMHANPVPLPASTRAAAAALARKTAARAGALSQPGQGSGLPALPDNFALQTSEQALLNHPSVDWAPAYEALQARYHQLPGAGETITNVSLGDLDSADIPSSDPCSSDVSTFGPTTVVQDGQRYLNWPSMPLIPTWTSSSAGTLDPTGEVCGVDPLDTEIGLDFSMMAPLPHSLQRSGELGSGLTDLLGVAPGASFRLVVPSDPSPSITSIDQAFLAAGRQTPRPNVITASLGFGLDAQGFPARYLEDDPVTEQVVSTLVHQDHINVAISSGDGLRTFTNAAVAPSGGAAATNVARPGTQPTDLNDLQLSTAPSADPDSGAIDAGGVTLDDIFAAPPQNPANADLAAQHAFPIVRWDGSANFASGFGSRVNVSAPGDDVIGFEHSFGAAADAVDVVNVGGTSASAPEIAAAAAVTQQAARLTGNKAVATDPLALRAYLAKTAAPVPAVGQADQNLNVGPQLDVGNAVTGLLQAAGYQLPAGVARVAVEQRQPLFNGTFDELDTVFVTSTNPAAISLDGANQNAWVTIAPDWTGLPAGTSYRLYAIPASGPRQLLASGPWARLQPAAIMGGAGLTPSPQTAQTVNLSYVASTGGHVRAQADIPLTFTPISGTPMPLAPSVDSVSRGSTITVNYDLTGQTQFTNPTLEVSPPGRVNPLQNFYHPIYSVPLTSTSGTVQIPVAALDGGGVYGIGILANGSPQDLQYSDFAVTRIPGAASDVRPTAPLLSAPGSPAGHLLTIPYGGPFSVSWDVRGVPHATGALLEISNGGPNGYGTFATFNNPNGTVRDNDGRDTGSIYAIRVSGTSGRTTLTGTQAGLYATLYHNVRVIPLLASGAAAGEGSDVSTISMNGVAPADGGAAGGGYGINESGTDGFVTSNQFVGNGRLTSVQTFDQTTNAITGTVASTSNGDIYTTALTGGPGMFSDDTGLYAVQTPAPSTTYNLLHPVASGTIAGQWTPPASLASPGFALFLADDQQDSDAAFMGFGNFSVSQPQVFTSNVAQNTFGPAISLAPEVSGMQALITGGIAQDPATGHAAVVEADAANPAAGSTLMNVDLGTGAVSTIPGVGNFFSNGVAIDSASNTATSPQLFGIGLYNLGNDTGTFIQPGGMLYQTPAADPGRGEFLVEELAPPGSVGLFTTVNNNPLSAELVINDQGRVLARIPHFNFFSTPVFVGADDTQLNPGRDTGYTFGLFGQQLAPFGY